MKGVTYTYFATAATFFGGGYQGVPCSIGGSVHWPLSFRAIPLALISCGVKHRLRLWVKRPTRCRSNAETLLKVRLHPVQ